MPNKQNPKRRRWILVLLPVLLLALFVYAQSSYRRAVKHYEQVTRDLETAILQDAPISQLSQEHAYAEQLVAHAHSRRRILLIVGTCCTLLGEVLTILYDHNSIPQPKQDKPM